VARPAAPSPSESLLSPATGEFADPEREAAFLSDLAAANHRRWRSVADGIATLFVAFTFVDLASLGPSRAWAVLLGLRLLAAAVTVAVGRVLDLDPAVLATSRGARLLVAAQLATCGVALAATAARPGDALTNALSMTVVTLACVVLVPGRFTHQFLLGAAVLGGLTVVSVLRFHDPPLPTVPLTANLTAVLLVATTIRSLLNRDQRRQWLAVQEADRATARLAEQLDAAAAMGRELQRLAREDPLTRAANRREFLAALEARGGGARQGVVSVLILDLDRFKAINDQYGHAAGDQVLVGVVEATRSAVRDGDLVARLGGEEFAVLLAGLTLEAATEVAERVRAAIRAHPPPAGVATPVTASVGVAEHLPGEPVASLLARADAAMYRAKRAGGDAVSASGGHELAPVSAAGRPRSTPLHLHSPR
jgi:diguanylate cyclase (GGDEF)-like protein